MGAHGGWKSTGNNTFLLTYCRGTSGSGGTFGFFDGQERQDMHDLVEWTAQQPWSNGNVRMIGISYFAGTQMEAAVERPPHLKAIMPVAGTFDAPDTAFIAVLQDIDENGNAINITAGYLRAGLREVAEAASKRGAPFLPCRTFETVPIGEKISYRIPLVPNARRFRAGHRLRLYLTTDDQNADRPALLEFRHGSIGTSSFNTVFSSSRLFFPVLR
jgi:predicted acyl esterase